MGNLLVDYVLMSSGNCARGRALGPAVFGFHGFLLLSLASGTAAQPGPAVQPPEPSVSGVSDTRPDLDRELRRAESLFTVGDRALSEGREVAAREAFDAALDIFVDMKGPGTTDPRFLSAYTSLIDRIVTAEVARGSDRQAIAVAAPPAAAAQANQETEAPPGNTLAEMGDRIENASPTEGARETNEAVLGAEILDLPIELNDQVLGAIDLYSGRFNKWFAEALSRGTPHLPRIREILAEAGIPEDLAYVPIVESAFNPSALSRAKAKGLWQFIPSTGRQYGLRQDFFVDERSNMEKATMAAAQYLKKLYAMFGDWNLALAGYNAGEGRVLQAIKRANTNDFWALAKTRSFRAETKNYVPLIHAAIVIAKSPESYGIDVAPLGTVSSETVRVAGSYPITTVARCANADPAEIRQLNPELRRGLTPSFAFDLKVPNGSAGQVTTCLAGERAMDFTRHVIRRGDTLSRIASMFGVPASEIARANNLSLKSTLRPGVELAIPRREPRETATPRTADYAGSGPSYKIRKGDTLSSVAARHGTTVDAIKALNGLHSSRLSIGQVLRVASASTEGLP